MSVVSDAEMPSIVDIPFVSGVPSGTFLPPATGVTPWISAHKLPGWYGTPTPNRYASTRVIVYEEVAFIICTHSGSTEKKVGTGVTGIHWNGALWPAYVVSFNTSGFTGVHVAVAVDVGVPIVTAVCVHVAVDDRMTAGVFVAVACGV